MAKINSSYVTMPYSNFFFVKFLSHTKMQYWPLGKLDVVQFAAFYGKELHRSAYCLVLSSLSKIHLQAAHSIFINEAIFSAKKESIVVLKNTQVQRGILLYNTFT